MAEFVKAYYKAKNTPREKKFSNKLIEFLSRTPIYQPVTLFIIGGLTYIYLSIFYFNLAILPTVGLFFGGWLAFTLLEYCMHRFLFHMSIHNKLRKDVQYNAHGIHHEYPKDKDTLAMPLPFSITLGAAFIGLFYLIMGTYGFAWTGGMYVGYGLYLLMHYLVHAVPPPNNFLKILWVNHAIHHYKDDEVVFGVSSLIWDYIFGTMPKKEDQEK